MNKRFSGYARAMSLFLGLLILAGLAGAQGRGRLMPLRQARPQAEFQRFSLSLAGGYGFVERGGGVADFKAEFQYGISRSLRLGLSLGYLARGGHNGERDRDGRGGMMMDTMPLLARLLSRQEPSFGRELRSFPVGLNLYYTLPVGRRWDGYLFGGGTFAFGSFQASAGSVHKNAFGGQAGLGFEYALAPKLRLTAEAGYRFLTFGRVKLPLPELSPLLRMIVNTVAPQLVRPVEISLNGFALRAGVKFGL
jgi:opacity protein-like surface antigen